MDTNGLNINHELEWNKGTFDNRDRKISSISSNCFKDLTHTLMKKPSINDNQIFVESP
jgi:hypothetical protein